jgi:hypothetical protein
MPIYCTRCDPSDALYCATTVAGILVAQPMYRPSDTVSSLPSSVISTPARVLYRTVSASLCTLRLERLPPLSLPLLSAQSVLPKQQLLAFWSGCRRARAPLRPCVWLIQQMRLTPPPSRLLLLRDKRSSATPRTRRQAATVARQSGRGHGFVCERVAWRLHEGIGSQAG